jgi:YgiT-type zinc finger domain-containing protein
MKCSIEGCQGEYEAREIYHTIRHLGKVIVIDHVPADVCSLCGDTLLGPNTVRHIESLLEKQKSPSRMVPLYEYDVA